MLKRNQEMLKGALNSTLCESSNCPLAGRSCHKLDTCVSDGPLCAWQGKLDSYIDAETFFLQQK